MIKSVKLKEDYVCFFDKQQFVLKPITLLVGDQGCGKSTFLGLLKSLMKGEESKCYDVKMIEPLQTKLMSLDLEHDNPRMSSKNMNTFSSQDMLYGMSVKFQSHGEVLMPILNVIDSQTDSLILLDEPETSLSLRSQYQMIDTLKRALERNNQIVMATHNLVFMQAFEDNILSLEHLKYVSSTEFIELQKVENNFKSLREDKIIKDTKCHLGIKCTCANDTGWYNNKCEHYINSRGTNPRRRKT